MIFGEGLIVDLLLFIFSKHRYPLITVIGEGKYFNIVQALNQHNLSYRTSSRTMEPYGTPAGAGSSTQYVIYVKKQDKHLAEHALNEALRR
ncbi:hypothetical protein LJK88_02095 [Paenibacillus sp. P26]|nr:hypothetical protein LJK88_02095 [Paenibacillus sp. P26]